MIKRLIFITLTLFVSLSIHCQSNYKIFRQAISEMYKSSQIEKPALEKAIEGSEKTVSKYRNDKPIISVFGGTPEQNKKIENEIIEFTDTEISSEDIVESAPPPPPPMPKREKTKAKKPSKKKEKRPNINFSQKPMFPSKQQGKKLVSHDERASQPQEEIVWIEGETFTTTETIYIEDIPDPAERKKATEIGNHNGNIITLRRINFIEAIYLESETEAGFNKMMKDLKAKDLDFSKNFKTLKALEGNEKVEYIKGKLQDLVNKV